MIYTLSLQDHRIIKQQVVKCVLDKLRNVVNRTFLMIRPIDPSQGL
jgi:hypothetical protein